MNIVNIIIATMANYYKVLNMLENAGVVPVLTHFLATTCGRAGDSKTL